MVLPAQFSGRCTATRLRSAVLAFWAARVWPLSHAGNRSATCRRRFTNEQRGFLLALAGLGAARLCTAVGVGRNAALLAGLRRVRLGGRAAPLACCDSLSCGLVDSGRSVDDCRLFVAQSASMDGSLRPSHTSRIAGHDRSASLPPRRLHALFSCCCPRKKPFPCSIRNNWAIGRAVSTLRGRWRCGTTIYPLCTSRLR